MRWRLLGDLNERFSILNRRDNFGQNRLERTPQSSVGYIPKADPDYRNPAAPPRLREVFILCNQDSADTLGMLANRNVARAAKPNAPDMFSEMASLDQAIC